MPHLGPTGILFFATPRLPAAAWAAATPNADVRQNLTVYESLDGGRAWTIRAVAYDGLSAYSDMAYLPPRDGIGVLFELGVGGKQYTSVAFTVVPVGQ